MGEEEVDLVPVSGMVGDTLVSGFVGSSLRADVLTAARVHINEYSSIKVGEMPEYTVWCVGRDGSIYSIANEDLAARLAEDYFDHAIYFFGTLV